MARTQSQDALTFVCVGHVDHGKSSLIGRLLMDTNTVHQDVVEKVRRISKERGKHFEYAFLLDAFQEEREQGITIDTTKIEFCHDDRRYIIIDAPGHKEFLKNMASGASRAEAALLLIDAEEGIREQTRKHAYLLSLLGIHQVTVVVNKMDLVQYAEDVFSEVEHGARDYLKRLGIDPLQVIPVSAIEGDNISSRSTHMQWYHGPTVLEMLADFREDTSLRDKPLRLPLQDVYKFDNRRILAGRVEAGRIEVGDAITIHPDGKQAHVISVEHWPESQDAPEASAGRCVGITIDEEFFLERGNVITHANERMNTSTLVAATVFWMGREPLCMNHQYTLKIHTQRVSCTLHSIDKVIDAETLDALENHGELGRYMAGEVVFRLQNPVVFDAFTECPTTGRFVVVDGYDVAGGGIINRIPELLQERQEISPRSMFISPKEGLVSMKERADRRKHRGHVVWLTGLSGSGKSRIAQRMERSLWDSAIDAYYLDSSNVRMTLSSDLAFSEKQRREHSRRVAELANYLMHAGHVVIVSIISPFQDDREYARGIIGERNFSEVFINTPLDVCKRRNPHGIYTKVASAEIKGVPGIDLPYEQSERLIHTIHIKNIDTPLEPIADELAEVIMKNVT